ncbi:MAG: 3-mercaptopyruvate sulfurtransferase [Aestuariivirga sp.]
MGNIVSTAWLAEHLRDSDLLILDASWHLPTAKRDAKAEFLRGHIPGAQFFDIDAISDRNTTLPHMLPSAENFAHDVGKLGASNSTKIICYDSVGLFSAARCWWMFKIFGHDNVAVLDGGLKKWLTENRDVEQGAVAPKPGNFTANFRPGMVKSADQVASEKAQVADARSPARFRGEEAEPRPGVRPGHITGARNVHYASVLNADGTMKPVEELSSIFANAGVDLQNPVTTSCGSGVTAAILTLALTELGVESHALYDGSWAEWGGSSRPIETGPAR